MKPNCMIPAIMTVLLMSTSAGLAGNQLPSTRAVGAPAGFAGACAKYGWLCSNASASGQARDSQLGLLKRVNASVNASVRPVADAAKSRSRDNWSLPANGKGDCEDYAILKYKRLVEAGFSPAHLALSVVLDRRGNNHVVLVARLVSGDVVLDNLAGSVKPWHRTGYTFVAHQGFQKKSQWKVSLAGPRAKQLLRADAGSRQ